MKITEQEFKKAASDFYKLRNQYDKQKETELLPSLKKKYEGKYFKYRNSYGSGDSWWLYFYIKEVKSPMSFIVDRFQVTPRDCDFRVGCSEFSDCCFSVEIKKSEYNRAAKKFVNAANRLLKH